MSNPDGVRVALRVIPNSTRSEIVGWHDGALKVKVQAPPEGGRANREVIQLLSKSLGIGKRNVSMERGETSRNKTVRIERIDETRLQEVLGPK